MAVMAMSENEKCRLPLKRELRCVMTIWPFRAVLSFFLTLSIPEMNLFFGKAKSKTTAKDSIVKLRETLAMLEKRQAHLETKAENEYKIAKLNATKNRRG